MTTCGGIISCNSSNRFAASATVIMLTPVTLPPGRLRLVTRPNVIGSPALTKTIGMVESLPSPQAPSELHRLQRSRRLDGEPGRTTARAVDRIEAPPNGTRSPDWRLQHSPFPSSLQRRHPSR